MAAARAALFALALCLAVGAARGESYAFSGEELASGTLRRLYKFYVYATDSGEALAAGAQPYVELSSFVEVPSEGRGLQATCSWTGSQSGWWNGGTIIANRELQSPSDCRALCCDTAQCEGFTWRHSDSMCQLKSDLHGVTWAPDEGHTSDQYLPYLPTKAAAPVPLSPPQQPQHPAGGIADGSTSGLQVSLIPYGKFLSFVPAGTDFCGDDGELVLQSPGAASHVISFRVPVGASADRRDPVRINITRTDVYVLTATNCGHLQRLHGRVTVTNAFGHLPGDSFYKMGFYALLTLFYTFLGLLWILMVLGWKVKGRQLHHLHHCISFVMLMSVIEAFFSWYFMLTWNRSSERSEALFVLNILVTVVKPAFAYYLVLVTSLGWGVTRPALEARTKLEAQALAFLYCFLHGAWEVKSFYRHAYDTPNGTLAMVYVPVLLVNAILFVWTLRALGHLSGELEGESRTMFKRVRGLMILALCVSLPVSALQLMDLAGVISEDWLPRRTAFKWHYQWFLFDGTGQIVFGLVLVGVLCQWAPQNDTNKYTHLFNQEAGQVADQKEGVVADDGDEEVDVAGCRDGRAQAGLPPDVLGSAAAHASDSDL